MEENQTLNNDDLNLTGNEGESMDLQNLKIYPSQAQVDPSQVGDDFEAGNEENVSSCDVTNSQDLTEKES